MAEETSEAVSKKAIENVENPFVAEGELSQKADYIISHSTITRTEIHIADPDNLQDENVDTPASPAKDADRQSDQNQTEVVAKETNVIPEVKPQQQQIPKPKDVAQPQSIQVEVGKGNASMVVPQRAEEVKLKKGKKCCKGCTII